MSWPLVTILFIGAVIVLYRHDKLLSEYQDEHDADEGVRQVQHLINEGFKK